MRGAAQLSQTAVMTKVATTFGSSWSKFTRWLRQFPLWAHVGVFWICGAATAVGAYWFIGRHVPTDSTAGLTSAQRFTAAFATVTAAGAVVALVVALRRQSLAERDEKSSAARDARDLDIARARQFTERFASAADLFGHEAPAARLAGVYAIAALADDYPARAQECVDVLCGYLRLPFEPEADTLASRSEDLTVKREDGSTVTTRVTQAQRAFDREVRATIIHVIKAHTQSGADPSWSALNLNLQRAHLVNADLRRCTFLGRVDFDDVVFSGQRLSLGGVTFAGDWTAFGGATFQCEKAWFDQVTFAGEHVWFDGAVFCGAEVEFEGARFLSPDVRFAGSRGDVTWDGVIATFDGATKGSRTKIPSLGTLKRNATITKDRRPFDGWPEPKRGSG